MTEAGTIELGADEGFQGLRAQTRDDDRVGDAGTDFFIDGQGQGLKQRGLANQDQVVRGRKVLEKQTKFAQAVGRHEMSIVDDGDEHFARAMDFKSFLNEKPFAAVIVAFELELKSATENAEGVVIGVKGAIDHGSDHPFGIVVEERMFEHALAGARFAKNQAEAALLGVNVEDVEDLLLMGKERDGLGIEGMALQAEMRTNHRGWALGVEVAEGFRSLATGLSSRASPMRSPL